MIDTVEPFRLPAGDARPLDVEEAQRRVLSQIAVLPAEEIAFHEAAGRVLREDVNATIDLPAADNSAMDGYAVRSADIASAGDPAPVQLKVTGDIRAGVVPNGAVDPGSAMRIMTGALVPRGADVVVQVELTDGGSDFVTVRRALPAGTNIRRRGEDMRAGQTVLREGTRIGAAEIGVLATLQKRRVAVGRMPTVAILTTGDEVIGVEETRTAGKVINSNAYAIAAMVRESGATPRVAPVIPDRLDATVAAIEAAIDCDIVLSTGGVSVGAFDFVRSALDSLGAVTTFWRVNMKPGKPVLVSRVGDRVFFGLPGNPVSSMIAFALFVAPALRKAAGQTTNLLSPMVNVRAQSKMKGSGDRCNYLRVRVTSIGGKLHAQPMPAQGSGVSSSMVQVNGLAVIDGGTRIEADAMVPVLIIGPIGSE